MRPAPHRVVSTCLTALVLVAVGAACGGTTPSTTATPSPSPTATPDPTPTPSPTRAPEPPLVVTLRDAGPAGTPWTAVQLSLIGEDGTVAGTVNDSAGVDGDAFFVGAAHVYFIEGTTVKAMGRDGTVTTVGQVPQVHTTVTADDEQAYTGLAVSPDESSIVFAIPLSIQGDNGAITDHSQLWNEPIGGTAATATMVYDDVSSAGFVLLPFAWSSTAVWVSQRPTIGLGGAGPFLDYSHFDAATFDPQSRVLRPATGDCFPSDDSAIESSSPNLICHALPTDRSVTVERPTGTQTLVMQPASATAFGAIRVSADGEYLAYGAYVGMFGSGHYTTTVVNLSSDTDVATVVGDTPMQWLSDDRLVVSPSFGEGATYLLSASFDNPVKLSADQPTGALP